MIDHLQLSAFLEVLREQSFEKAAQKLCVTPSAISQRIRALEDEIGTVLIIRDTPCRPTTEGEKLYRHALQVELLERDLSLDFQALERQTTRRIPIAVNSDSLATWFMDALKIFYKETGVFVEVVVEDEKHTDAWLKQGRVLGAITSQSKAVQGCKIENLGQMPYLPMASPDFKNSYFKDGLNKETFSKAPILMFGEKDRLQHHFVNIALGQDVTIHPPYNIIPSTHGFQDAAIAGLGWGVAPKDIIRPYFESGQLVNLDTSHQLQVPLYWQYWRLSSPTLNSLTRVIKSVAKERLD